MAVDIQEIASNNPEELSVQERFINYSAEGGMFNEALFEEILKNADKLDIKSLSPATQSQARSLARFAEIDGSNKTTEVYGLMRAQPMELSQAQLEDKDFQTQVLKMHTSSDQVLYAEALLITGNAREYVKFVNKYPHIFKKPV